VQCFSSSRAWKPGSSAAGLLVLLPQVRAQDSRSGGPDGRIDRSDDRITDAPHELLKKLAGGDRRSTGNVDAVVAAVRITPALFGALFEGMLAGDPVVRMRSADAAEKLTAGNSGLLAPYKRRLLREVAASPQQEVRWHVAQMIPRLTLTRTERAAAVETLISYLGDKSAIVKTFSMQALADLAENDAALTARVLPLIEELTAFGSAAVRNRGRKLLALLQGDAVSTQPGRGTDRAARARHGDGARHDDALLILRLQQALDAPATASARRFWEKYLKGAASFRGVPMAGVRRAAHRRREPLRLVLREGPRPDGV